MMLLGLIFGLKLDIKDGGLYIGNSVLKPYAYTVYKDYVVLEKYQGNEAEVRIPKEMLGKPVKVIGYECFEYKDELTEVVLNENVEIIDVRAFAECKNLVEIMQGENIKKIEDYAFNSCKKLKEVNVGNYLEGINEGAFSECIALKKMIPQENLKYIGGRAFLDSGLEEFVFNKNVEIGTLAFDGTSWMKNLLSTEMET